MIARKRTGGALPLVLIFFSVGILIVAFVALNWGQLFTHQKQAQTAVDAAALAVAREVAKVTITDPNFGRIGMVDAYTSQGLSAQPVFGINTIMARARLDYLVGRRLGNTTFNFLANRDADDAARATRRMNNELLRLRSGPVTYQDKDGNNQSINLQQVAADAFNSSGLRAAGTQPIAAADVTVDFGTLQGTGITNVPLPEPAGADPDSRDASRSATYKDATGQTRSFYRSGVNVPASGSTKNFIFAYIGDTQQLVDRASFQAAALVDSTSATPIQVPSVVRVTIRETVRAVATGREGPIQQQKVEIACAVPGGRRVTPPAGILRIEFPQGIPVQDNGGVEFNTPLSLMNSSMLPADASASTSASGATGWAGLGSYFTSSGGPFPGPGTVSPSNVNGRSQDNPSVALAFLVYDWVRNDGLRPNIEAVYKSLNEINLRTASLGETTKTALVPGDEVLFTDRGDFFMQPACAQFSFVNVSNLIRLPSYCNVVGGIFEMHDNSTDAMNGTGNRPADPRSLRWFTRSNGTILNEFMNQAVTFRTMLGTPMQMAWAPGTTMLHGLLNGEPSTTDGHPISQLLDYRQALIDQILKALDAANAAVQVTDQLWPEIDRLTNQILDKQAEIADIDAQLSALYDSGITAGDEVQELLDRRNQLEAEIVALEAELRPLQAQYRRAEAVYAAAVDAVTLAVAALQNMLNVTATGVHKLGATAYQVAGNNMFYPPTKAPSASDILNGTNMDTGQASGATGSRRWDNSPVFLNNLANYRTIICTPDVVGPLRRAFKFLSTGSSAEGSGGGVVVAVSDQLPNGWITPIRDPNTGYFDVPTNFSASTGIAALGEGQIQYQALNVYHEVSTADPRLHIVWSVMAQTNVRNPAANFNPFDPQQGGGIDCTRSNPAETDPAKKACDVEAARFQFTSPLLWTTIEVPEFQIPPPPRGLPAIPPVPPPPQPPRPSH